MSTEGYIFQGQQMQTVEFRNIHGPKKTAIVRCTEKMGQKMDRTFWTKHLDGPKHLGQKWANRWMLAKQMKQKWAKPSGTKNGPIWLQLQNTRFMGQKKGKNILTSFRQTHN